MAKTIKQPSKKVKEVVNKVASKTPSKKLEKPLKASKSTINKAKDLVINKLKTSDKTTPKKAIEITKESLLKNQVVQNEPVTVAEIGHLVKTEVKMSNTISFNDIKAKLNTQPVIPSFSFLNR